MTTHDDSDEHGVLCTEDGGVQVVLCWDDGGVQGCGASNKSSNDQQHSVSLCGVRGRDLHAVGLVLHRKAVLSSPRAEGARAFTGRRNSHSGKGEDFLSRQPNFFTETAVTPEQKVEKSFPRWEINRHAEG